MNKELIERIAETVDYSEITHETNNGTANLMVTRIITDDPYPYDLYEELTGVKLDNDDFVNAVKDYIEKHNQNPRKKFNMLSYLPEPMGLTIKVIKDLDTRENLGQVFFNFETMTDSEEDLLVYPNILKNWIKEEKREDIIRTATIIEEWEDTEEDEYENFYEFLKQFKED